MSLALALVVGPLVLAWLAPAVLNPAVHRIRDPFTVLLGWLIVTAATVLTFAAGVVLLLIPGGQQARLGYLAHQCWLAVRHLQRPGVDEALGAVGALALVALLVRLTTATLRHWRAQRRLRQAHQDLLTLLGGTTGPGPEPVLRMPYAAPVAYSVGGRRGLVVVSDGVEQLPPAQRAAVLCHEHAHLRGRHHLIVSAVDALAAALPWLPLTRQAPDAVRLLVELCADDAAVRACGPGAVGAALIALSEAPRPAHALSMSGSDVVVRLHRLQTAAPARRLPGRLAATTAALVAPALAGVLAIAAMCG
ncbi:M56 family metallopeptidase [Micromonospora sonneratiae]|uniref:M56 family metallopeptidase n=1 Tax=Micromonospora sonneratiae TaxID=1184706 RepID=A0ABW3Y6V2_9ACTN